MIQTTSRLSRGARRRRAQPGWLYRAALAVGIVLLGVFVVLKH
jgi:hypothetical protein